MMRAPHTDKNILIFCSFFNLRNRSWT